MADVDASGQLVMGNGAVIPLFRADLAEAAEEEIFTDSNFVGSAQNAGTYATQTLGNAVVAAGGVSAENDMTYAFIRSAGTIKLAVPVSGLSSGMGLPAALPYPKRLVSGDQLIAAANATSDREVGLSVACTMSSQLPLLNELVSMSSQLELENMNWFRLHLRRIDGLIES